MRRIYLNSKTAKAEKVNLFKAKKKGLKFVSLKSLFTIYFQKEPLHGSKNPK